MERSLIGLACCICFSCAWAQQAPEIEWAHALGGSQGESASGIHLTPDGGSILVGMTGSSNGDVAGTNGGNDLWVVKLDAAGEIQWERTYGGSDFDRGTSIEGYSVGATGGYIVSGTTFSTDGDITVQHGFCDAWVLKIDVAGNLVWQRTLGGSGDEQASNAQETSNGGYIFCGVTTSNDGDVTANHGGADIWLVKLDELGATEWQRTLGGSDDELSGSVHTTSDGGYIVTGYTLSNDGDVSGNHGEHDFWVVKLNSGGNIEWQHCLGGTNTDTGHTVRPTLDGGYIVCGNSSSNDGDVEVQHGTGDIWVVKLSASGSIQWERTYGGSGLDQCGTIDLVGDQGYVISGASGSTDGQVTEPHGGQDFWVVRIALDGTLLWQKSLGGSATDVAYPVRWAQDGSCLVAGYTFSNDGDVIDAPGNLDLWVVKLEDISTGEKYIDDDVLSVSPNPGHGVVWITSRTSAGAVSLYDASGRIVLQDHFTGPSMVLVLNELPPGCYTLRLKSDTAVSSVSVVLEQ